MKNMYSKLIISLCVLSCFAFAEKFTVAGINFESPKNWESSEPSNNMRKAQFSASSPSGKTAEVVFYYFGSG